MRRILTLLAVLALAVSPALGQTLGDKANIAGTPHDMTLTNSASGCTVCHSPHNSDSTLNTILLWNPAAASGSFNTYTGSGGIAGGTALDSPLAITDPQYASYLCLSCHDGTAANTNFGAGGEFNGATWNGGATTSDGVAAAVLTDTTGKGTLVIAGTDTDLTNDHPVNFTYPTGPTPGFALRSAAETAGLEFFGATPDSMQCATCHDPHDQNPAPTGNGFFLRTATNTKIDFCISCHL